MRNLKIDAEQKPACLAEQYGGHAHCSQLLAHCSSLRANSPDNPNINIYILRQDSLNRHLRRYLMFYILEVQKKKKRDGAVASKVAHERREWLQL